ncbi:hypothetical protein FB451DRAFT_1410384 [Mycena latifolia]|nr:hypothetical protein FB451DRAFT_1410384 [Mycena latifolia]
MKIVFDLESFRQQWSLSVGGKRQGEHSHRAQPLISPLLPSALTHSFLTVQLATLWRTLCALDAENELDACMLDSLKVFWALLALYLLAAAFVSFVGFFGVLQLLALLSPDGMCERATIALLAGMLVLTVICLHFLLAVSTHYPNVRAADAGLLDVRVMHSKREWMRARSSSASS